MSMLIIFLIMLWNLFASYWNARVAGKIWQESKAIGGFYHVATWSGAIMSACGFTMIYGILLAGIGATMGWLSKDAFMLSQQLIYVLIALPILCTGYIITIEAWIAAYREKSLLNVGAATLNTVITAWNTYSVVNNYGSALESIKEGFSGDKDVDLDFDSDLMKVIAVVAIALFGGILTTMLIIRRHMGDPLPLPENVQQKLNEAK